MPRDTGADTRSDQTACPARDVPRSRCTTVDSQPGTREQSAVPRVSDGVPDSSRECSRQPRGVGGEDDAFVRVVPKSIRREQFRDVNRLRMSRRDLHNQPLYFAADNLVQRSRQQLRVLRCDVTRVDVFTECRKSPASLVTGLVG